MAIATPEDEVVDPYIPSGLTRVLERSLDGEYFNLVN